MARAPARETMAKTMSLHQRKAAVARAQVGGSKAAASTAVAGVAGGRVGVFGSLFSTLATTAVRGVGWPGNDQPVTEQEDHRSAVQPSFDHTSELRAGQSTAGDASRTHVRQAPARRVHDGREGSQGRGEAGAAGQTRIRDAAARGEGGIANETAGERQTCLERGPGSSLVFRATDAVARRLATNGSPGESANGENHDEGKDE